MHAGEVVAYHILSAHASVSALAVWPAAADFPTASPGVFCRFPHTEEQGHGLCSIRVNSPTIYHATIRN